MADDNTLHNKAFEAMLAGRLEKAEGLLDVDESRRTGRATSSHAGQHKKPEEYNAESVQRNKGEESAGMGEDVKETSIDIGVLDDDDDEEDEDGLPDGGSIEQAEDYEPHDTTQDTMSTMPQNNAQGGASKFNEDEIKNLAPSDNSFQDNGPETVPDIVDDAQDNTTIDSTGGTRGLTPEDSQDAITDPDLNGETDSAHTPAPTNTPGETPSAEPQETPNTARAQTPDTATFDTPEVQDTPENTQENNTLGEDTRLIDDSLSSAGPELPNTTEDPTQTTPGGFGEGGSFNNMANNIEQDPATSSPTESSSSDLMDTIHGGTMGGDVFTTDDMFAPATLETTPEENDSASGAAPGDGGDGGNDDGGVFDPASALDANSPEDDISDGDEKSPTIPGEEDIAPTYTEEGGEQPLREPAKKPGADTNSDDDEGKNIIQRAVQWCKDNPLWAGIGAVVLVVLLVASTLMGGNKDSSSDGGDSSGNTGGMQQQAPDTGEQPTQDNKLQPASLQAACQAGSTDPQLAFNDDPSQAWVCMRSNGIDGNILHIHFDKPVIITSATIVPGFNYTEPSGKNLWDDYRVVSKVKWSFSSRDRYIQDVAPTPTGAEMQFPNVATQEIDLVVLRTEKAKNDNQFGGEAKDAFAISKLELVGHQA